MQPLPIEDITGLVGGLTQYYEIKGHFPESIDIFKEYCSDSNLPCNSLDFAKLSWKSVNDKKITVIYKGDGYSLPIELERDKDSVDLDKALENKLRDW
ncbi:MAG: hypothetical protein P8016_12260 [Sedimentisphaerales bacterium]